ncbi:PIN domain-containing protein [Tenacibaculum sp. Mcav3-52]|uniref:PIN domain-containing protein n=1 Tax=Tenacibaculum sp. Mcav3-52 TaxID=2917762 RepID=UPI001EF24B93|nr:PIN domain-containing protein [Tenacibaculum sp. Mcav3-52]MCG7501760.1 PIN domain-containing protein [Tenacibaculum sp. Mcav3-52]
MNIFLDTNILFEDYFFEKKSQKNILKYAKEGLIHLYMSEIVKLELRRQFIQELEVINKGLKKVIKSSERLKITEEVKLINVENQLKKFDDFYKELDSGVDNFRILKYNNDFLPDIVDRAIYRKKPFAEEKTELKDALIWKTYSHFVEKLELEDCILLTNNSNDFCSKKDKSKIHTDLLKDTDKFSVMSSAFRFLNEKSKIIESPDYKFSIYASSLDIDDEFANELLKVNFSDQIEKEIDKRLESINPFEILDNEYWNDGYVSGFEKEILGCSDVEYEVIGEKALISGKVQVGCEAEFYEYNSMREKGEDSFSFLGEHYLTFELYFNFDLEEDKECSDFEITDIEIRV